jgi:hypothetical protein
MGNCQQRKTKRTPKEQPSATILLNKEPPPEKPKAQLYDMSDEYVDLVDIPYDELLKLSRKSKK